MALVPTLYSRWIGLATQYLQEKGLTLGSGSVFLIVKLETILLHYRAKWLTCTQL